MGCQRSGTTLLTLILSMHPAVQVIDEPDTRFHVVSGETALLDFDLVEAASLRQRALLVFKAPRDTHRIDELFSHFRNARLLWLTRPVEPVVASMCRLRVTTDSWAFTHAPREARKYLQDFPPTSRLQTHFPWQSFRNALENKRSCLPLCVGSPKRRVVHMGGRGTVRRCR
jgi:hypothetical protein